MILFKIILAFSFGFSAAVTARPSTSNVAPLFIASSGVAIRFWSWEESLAIRIPGVMISLELGICCFTEERSAAEQTIPSKPVETANLARWQTWFSNWY